MTMLRRALATMIGASIAYGLGSIPVAAADPDDERAAEFCAYMKMSGYVTNDCGWMSLVAQGQCIGLMNGKSAWDMMDTSRVMAKAETQDAQWTILKTAVNVYCPIMDSMLPMSP